jgi:hypothetical protein
MNRVMKSFLVCTVVLSFASSGWANPQAWLSTQYRPDFWSSGSWYRSPVTDGYMDVRLLIENAAGTEITFSIAYDSTLIHPVGSGSLMDLMAGLTLSAVTVDNMEGNWKKSTMTFTGNFNIGTIQYESDAVLRLRLYPIAEGTVPLGLWSSGSLRYPASYKTCSLTLKNGGVVVPVDRKEWNDATQLITFTDKTSATVTYQYDYNLGTPIANGFFRVTYADNHIEEFHASNPALGITLDKTYGGYFITPQANAVMVSLIFPEYEDIMSMDMSGGWSVTHKQPDGYLFVQEVGEGQSGGLRATTDDITLTVVRPGIGMNFDAHGFDAAIIGNLAGVLDKTTDFQRVGDDSVRMIIRGGLAADDYNLYLYKDGLILGRIWFTASTYYAVSFIVKDQNGHALPGAIVAIPQCGMMGCSNLEKTTDQDGKAVHQLPGNPQWGQFFNYFVTLADHEDATGSIQVFASDMEVPIVMGPVKGLDLADFANLASNWSMQFCQWNNYCNGADRNRDGSVNLADLVLFADRWLKNK